MLLPDAHSLSHRSFPATSSVLITLPKNEVPQKVPSAKPSGLTTQTSSSTIKIESAAPLNVGDNNVLLQVGQKSPGISPGVGKTSAGSRPQAEVAGVKGKGPCSWMGSLGSAIPQVLLDIASLCFSLKGALGVCLLVV